MRRVFNAVASKGHLEIIFYGADKGNSTETFSVRTLKCQTWWQRFLGESKIDKLMTFQINTSRSRTSHVTDYLLSKAYFLCEIYDRLHGVFVAIHRSNSKRAS